MKSRRRKYIKKTRRKGKRRKHLLIKKKYYGRKKGKAIPIYGHKIPKRIGRRRFYISWKTTKKNLPGKTYHGNFYYTRKEAQHSARRRLRRRQKGGFLGALAKTAKGMLGDKNPLSSAIDDVMDIIPCDKNERPDYPGGPDGCGKNISPKPTDKQLRDGYVAEDQIYQLDDF